MFITALRSRAPFIRQYAFGTMLFGCLVMASPIQAASLTYGGITLEYREHAVGKSGPGPRGIDILVAGNPKIEYKFAPNPHVADSKWYNKHHEKFYTEAAQRIVDKYNLVTPHAWPAPAIFANGAPPANRIIIHGVEYTLITF